MKFQIKNVNPINEANIDIGQINVVCGYNGTGKSTVSKLLYCILKASCNNRQNFAYLSIINRLGRIINRISDDFFKVGNMDIMEVLEVYEDEKDEYFSKSDYPKKYIVDEIERIDEQLEMIKKDDESLSLSILKNLLKLEFSTRTFTGCFTLKNNLFSYLANFEENNKIDFNEYITTSDSLDIWDVFYLESFSIFDFNLRLPIKNNYYNRVDFLNKILHEEGEDLGGDVKNSLAILEKIESIIGGKFCLDRGKFIFNSFDMENTASGIKQIGVIQLLLFNHKLRQNSFLIIDEPEVNLHPDWQFKFAEILVLLSKELNITIYINSHSPLFIEAIRTYSDKYDLLDDTNFYLSDKSDINGKFDIFKVSHNNLSSVYRVLGKPYEILSEISIENEFKL